MVDRLKKHLGTKQNQYSYFSDDEILDPSVDFLFSIGGDGTLLRSITVVRNSKIPIFGINTGRLGFLTSLHRDALEEGLDAFFKEKYTFIERSLLKVNTKNPVSALEEIGFALNEVSVNRKNTTSMLSIDAELDGKHLPHNLLGRRAYHCLNPHGFNRIFFEQWRANSLSRILHVGF